MPALTGPIAPDGCLVEVRLGWSTRHAAQLRLALRPVPPPILVPGLLDTGAEATCFDPGIIQTLGLGLASVVPTNIPASGGWTLAAHYAASLTVVHPSGDPRQDLVLGNHPVLAIDIGALGYQALIGRDVLYRCRFLFDGPATRFELNY